MTIRSLFLIVVSGLLIAITVIASLFVAVETKSAISGFVECVYLGFDDVRAQWCSRIGL